MEIIKGPLYTKDGGIREDGDSVIKKRSDTLTQVENFINEGFCKLASKDALTDDEYLYLHGVYPAMDRMRHYLAAHPHFQRNIPAAFARIESRLVIIYKKRAQPERLTNKLVRIIGNEFQIPVIRLIEQ